MTNAGAWVPALARRWDAPIYAHPLELPYLTGRSAYPPPDPTVGGGALALLSPLFSPGPFDFRPRMHPLPDDGSVPGMPGWRWVHTPGHTPGHVAFWREEDGALIAGERFTAHDLGAMAVILLGVVIITLSKARAARPAPPPEAEPAA